MRHATSLVFSRNTSKDRRQKAEGRKRFLRSDLVVLRSLLVLIAFATTAESHAAGPSATAKTSEQLEPPVAAVVGDEPVYEAEVDDILAGAAKSGGHADAASESRRPALEQAINRRLVAQYFAKQGYAIDEEETQELLDELKRKLQVQKITFEEFLHRHGFNELMVRRRLQWDAMWAQFLKNEATDEALAQFFQSHRREYDGTELRVSHILWPVKPADDPEKLGGAKKEADDVRSRIEAGTLSFAEAAKKRSAGPSRRNGGDLGFIPLHGVMSEAFSRAAFKLKKGDVSQPIIDPFGVHLIACTDEKPGDRTWRDARRELFAAFTREKFLELAAAQRKRVKVKIIADAR